MTEAYTVFLTETVLNGVLLAVLLYLVGRNRVLSRRWTRAYLAVTVLVLLMLAAEAVTVWCDGQGAAWRTLNAAANALGFGLSPLIPLLLAHIYDDAAPRRRIWLWALPGAVQLALAAASPWTGWIFSLSPANVYARGPLFGGYVAAYLCGLAALVCASARQLRRQDRGARVLLAALLVIFVGGTTLQVVCPQIHSSWHSVTIVLVLYYLFQREQLYQCDSLTGLLNRQAFERCCEQQKSGRPLTVVMFDIDHFKEVNDTQGHLRGDEYLRTAAQLVQRCYASVGPCYRVGGDEFCVVGGEVPPERLARCAAALTAAVAQEQRIRPAAPGISAGAASGTDGLEECRRRADAALYAAKRARG